jgi:hypothetical protein
VNELCYETYPRKSQKYITELSIASGVHWQLQLKRKIMKTIVTNAFSLNMVTTPSGAIQWQHLADWEAPTYLCNDCWESAVGHSSTAAVFSNVLGVPIATCRTTITLTADTQLLVGQYIGPRLEEGVTTLPEGASIKWMIVRLAPEST